MRNKDNISTIDIFPDLNSKDSSKLEAATKGLSDINKPVNLVLFRNIQSNHDFNKHRELKD